MDRLQRSLGCLIVRSIIECAFRDGQSTNTFRSVRCVVEVRVVVNNLIRGTYLSYARL